MKRKDLPVRLLYPAKLSFKINGEIKNLPNKKKQNEFVTTELVLYELLKGLLYLFN